FAATTAGLLASAGFLVHRGPRSTLRLAGRDPPMLVALRDVFCFSLLLTRVSALVTFWHDSLPFGCGRPIADHSPRLHRPVIGAVQHLPIRFRLLLRLTPLH